MNRVQEAFGELRSLLGGARPEDGARRFRDALYILQRHSGAEYVALRDQILIEFTPPWPIPARDFAELEALSTLLPKEMPRSLVILDRPLGEEFPQRFGSALERHHITELELSGNLNIDAESIRHLVRCVRLPWSVRLRGTRLDEDMLWSLFWTAAPCKVGLLDLRDTGKDVSCDELRYLACQYSHESMRILLDDGPFDTGAPDLDWTGREVVLSVSQGLWSARAQAALQRLDELEDSERWALKIREAYQQGPRAIVWSLYKLEDFKRAQRMFDEDLPWSLSIGLSESLVELGSRDWTNLRSVDLGYSRPGDEARLCHILRRPEVTHLERLEINGNFIDRLCDDDSLGRLVELLEDSHLARVDTIRLRHMSQVQLSELLTCRVTQRIACLELEELGLNVRAALEAIPRAQKVRLERLVLFGSSCEQDNLVLPDPKVWSSLLYVRVFITNMTYELLDILEASLPQVPYELVFNQEVSDYIELD